jgi:penicillin-binding protein 2
MSVIHAPRRPIVDIRLLIFPIACGAFLLVIFLRLWYFQVVMAGDLTERANRTHPLTVSVLPPRGRILDRNGTLIAGVRPEVVVTAIPSVLNKHPDVLSKIAEILGVSVEELNAKLPHVRAGLQQSVADLFSIPTEKTDLNLPLTPLRLPVPIFVGATAEQAAKIDESPFDLPGIGVTTQPMRYDADSVDVSHVLGYVWTPDQNDLNRLKGTGDPPAYVGKSGVEYAYERMLMGVPGTEQVVTDAKHQPVRVVKHDIAVPGAELTLSLDLELQKLASKELNGRRGAVVALDPSTGEVLCFVSSPGYDLADFEGGIAPEQFAAYNANEDKPLEDKALTGLYPPGSTFKLITSLAMYETNNFNVNETVLCDGAFHITKKSKIRCLEVHNHIAYVKALTDSCNTYFCTMGVRVGPEALAKAAAEMGLGEAPDLDVRGGNSPRDRGVIPSPEYRAEHGRGHWYTGDTANAAIGQGDDLATPIQMADVAALVANRGVMYRPHLLKAVRLAGSTKSQETKPIVAHKVEASDFFWDELTEGLHGVIETGTAANCKIPGVPWAGKTGTAERANHEKPNSWFIGYAPLNHPRIAVAVIVVGAGFGASVAGPIAQQVVEAYLSPPKPAKTEAISVASPSARVASADRP